MSKFLEKQHKSNTVVSESLSDKYAPVNTKLLLAPFFNQGWELKYGQRYLNKKGIGSEKLTLIHPAYLYSNGDQLTIECINSNDGSTALMLYGGYGRVVCSNGLVIGELEGGRFVHRGTKIYSKIEHQYDTILGHLNVLKSNVDRLKSVIFTDQQVNNAIRNIGKEIYNKDTKKYLVESNVTALSIDRLKRVRREGDKGKDGFTLLNIVQENIIRRGLLVSEVHTLNKETNERDTTRKYLHGSEDKLSSVKLNNIISKAFLQEVA